MENSIHFNKSIHKLDDYILYSEFDYITFEVVSDIVHHFRISKKPIYIVDLRETENFFYDGTWLYMYVSEKMLSYSSQISNITDDFDFDNCIKYCNKHHPYYKLLNLNCERVLFHRVKKTSEQLLDMLDIVWSRNAGWTFTWETITSSLS